MRGFQQNNPVASGAVWQVACTANTTANSTTNVAITGFSQTIVCPGAGAIYVVHFDLAWSVAAATVAIAELLVDGVAQTIQMTFNPASTDRTDQHKMWVITGLSAGSHTFTGRVRNTAAATAAIVNATHSTMTIERKV